MATLRADGSAMMRRTSYASPCLCSTASGVLLGVWRHFTVAPLWSFPHPDSPPNMPWNPLRRKSTDFNLVCPALASKKAIGFFILSIFFHFRCTAVYGTPTMHIDIIHAPSFEKHDVTSLKAAVTAGSICPEELIRRMKERYTVDNVIVSIYPIQLNLIQWLNL